MHLARPRDEHMQGCGPALACRALVWQHMAQLLDPVQYKAYSCDDAGTHLPRLRWLCLKTIRLETKNGFPYYTSIAQCILTFAALEPLHMSPRFWLVSHHRKCSANPDLAHADGALDLM